MTDKKMAPEDAALEEGDDSADEKKTNKKESPMADIAKETPARPLVGDVVEGPVVAIGRARVFVDLSPFGTGIIYGREYLSARETLKNVNVGDTIAAKVVDAENEDGYIEISLREARQALIWNEAEAAVTDKKVFELTIKDSNKGGLILDWQGITGFLPASQLAPENYPRVPDGDKDRISSELQRLVGEKIEVQIITANPKEQKLIFAQKGADGTERANLIEKYHVGEITKGEITGATEFGVFVKLEEGLEGLVHISEMDWALVEDPRSKYKVGDKVEVKVIEIKDDKISLSIKALTEDPWQKAKDKYKKGQRVDAVVIKYNKHGALASVEEGVAGLVHISEFETEEQLRHALELGKVYSFTITLFEPGERRMTLSLKNGVPAE